MIKKKITILVAIYNIDKYLDKCLSSLSKINSNIAWIYLIDDGSTDKSSDICKKYSSRFGHIKYFSKLNGGLVSVRKFGLNLVKTKYVTFVDGDDWIEKGYYEYLLKKAIDSNADIVVAGHKEEINGTVYEVALNAFKSGYYENKKLKSLIKPNFLSQNRFYRPGIFTFLWNKVFRVNFIRSYVLSVPKKIIMGEDAAIFVPSMLNSKKIYISSKSGYHYVQHEKSIMKSLLKHKIEYENINLLNCYLKNMILKYRSLNIYSQLSDYINSLKFARCWSVYSSLKIPFWPYQISIKNTKSITIVGTGNYFTHLSNFFKSRKLFYKIKINIVDAKNPSFVNKCFKNSKIIVAQFAPKERDKIIKKLIKYGISRKNIYDPEKAYEFIKRQKYSETIMPKEMFS